MNSEESEIDIRFKRWKLKLMRWRVRVARVVLLPELSPKEAFELRHKVMDEGALSHGYILMCALSAGIATLGLLQSSTAVVIGAMLISPLMSPIAALGFGFASLDGQRIRDAIRVVIVGALIGIFTGMLLTWLSPIRNATPEILARTEPTLLDLGVALLSGIAGGYATVRGQGGTAIGVAIATALMPPLATVGYGLGVFQPMFALGAFLLFLTNLSAITFAFALVARLSGAARPFRNVEWKLHYVAAGLAAFSVLATPLALTLVRVTHEASLRLAARSAILNTIDHRGVSIAQLDVSWPLIGDPHVSAIVVTPQYEANAENALRARLARIEGDKIQVNLQQILAADFPSQTRAMIDAAMERTVTGIAADVPPFERVRASIGLPTRGIWTNRAERVINIEPLAAPGWTFADYRDAERRANAASAGWAVRLLPPVSVQLRIPLSGTARPGVEGEISLDDAIWALQRWGMTEVGMVLPGDQDGAALINSLRVAGIASRPLENATAPAGMALIEVVGPPPSRQREGAPPA